LKKWALKGSLGFLDCDQAYCIATSRTLNQISKANKGRVVNLYFFSCSPCTYPPGLNTGNISSLKTEDDHSFTCYNGVHFPYIYIRYISALFIFLPY